LDNGLIQENESLNDEKAAALIFLPDFSTANKLTDISGRGVGMDTVVALQKRGGYVKINFLDNKRFCSRAFETVVYLPSHYAVSTKSQ